MPATALDRRSERQIMADNPSLSRRLQDFKASKTQLFWACATCVVATMVVGFTWGGWVTGGTANGMAASAATGARAELAAAVCVQQFVNGPDAVAKLASLKGADAWKRDGIIEKDGWVTLVGMDKPVSGAAALCVRQLMDDKLPMAKAIKTSG